MTWLLLACDVAPFWELFAPSNDGDEVAALDEEPAEDWVDPNADFTLDDADVQLYGYPQSRFGWNVTDLGDLNGDWVGDFGVSCPDSGPAWIVHGPLSAGSGPVADFATGTISDAGRLGYSMASAGDVDRDHNGDILVGTPHWTAPGDVYGTKVYVFTGPAMGDLDPADAYITWEGAEGSWVGASVDGDFDLNADGRVDYVIGAPSAGAPAFGAAYVVYGPTTAGRYDLETDADVRISGESVRALGGLVAGIHDLDGDGADELVLADWERREHSGAFYLFRGGTIAGASDVEHADIVFGATHDGLRAVADAGDTNRDGYRDLWITDGAMFGAAYLFLGPVTVGGSLPEVADAAVVGTDDHDEVGIDVDGDADLNHDGHADVLIGSTNALPQTSAPGAVYTLLGPISGTIPVTDAHRMIAGNDRGEIAGQSVAFIGDQDGDAVPEALIGALDYIEAEEVGRVTMVLGNRL